MGLLEAIWDRQAAFNRAFVPLGRMTRAEQEAYTKEVILSIQSELATLLENITWKPHRREQTKLIESNIREELVDIFKFWNGLCLAWGINPSDFIQEWIRKTGVVEQRYRQEFACPYDPTTFQYCAIVDIDGVLADYVGGVFRFIKDKTGVEIPTYDGSTDFYSFVARYVGVEQAYILKHEYRETGQKLKLDPIPGAKEFLEWICRTGGYVLLLTARPAKKYKRIMADTITWLFRNGLKFHSILWDEDKASRVVQEYPFAKFIVEDDLSNAKALAAKGFKVYLRNTSYNAEQIVHERIWRFNDYEVLIRWLGSLT